MADLSEWIRALPDLELDEIILAYHELDNILDIACDSTNSVEAVTASCAVFEVGFGLDLFDAAPDREMYAEFMRRLGPLTTIQPGGIEGPLRLAQLRAQFAPRLEAIRARLEDGPTRGY